MTYLNDRVPQHHHQNSSYFANLYQAIETGRERPYEYHPRTIFDADLYTLKTIIFVGICNQQFQGTIFLDGL